MQLTLDTALGSYYIRSYEPGKIIINNEPPITNSIIVTAKQLINPWQPRLVSELTAEHLVKIFELDPEVVLLGTGKQLTFPVQGLLEQFYQNKIGIEVMNTAAACRTYNVLMSEGRRVIAALLLG